MHVTNPSQQNKLTQTSRSCCSCRSASAQPQHLPSRTTLLHYAMTSHVDKLVRLLEGTCGSCVPHKHEAYGRVAWPDGGSAYERMEAACQLGEVAKHESIPVPSLLSRVWHAGCGACIVCRADDVLPTVARPARLESVADTEGSSRRGQGCGGYRCWRYVPAFVLHGKCVIDML